MRHWAIAAVAVAAVFGLTLATGTRARADGINVLNQGAQNNFPNGVHFTVFATSSVEVKSVRLRFHVLPDGPQTTTTADCNGTTAVSCSADVGNTTQLTLVPGAQISYVWQLQDTNGGSTETPETTYTYQDTRFQWDPLTDGNITVYSYSGSDQLITSILTTARDTIDRMSQIEGTTIDFPVKVFVYSTAQQMAPATASTRGLPPGTTQGIILGEVGSSDTALVSRDNLGFLDTVRHELTHVVTGRATKGALAPLPSWINEGTSVSAQNQMLPDEQQALSDAIRRNRVLPVSTLDSVATRDSNPSLFYGEAGAIMKFLIGNYGADKFAQFLAALKSNSVNDAFNKVYGFDETGLENAWRQSVGLPVVTPAAGGGAGKEIGIPSIVPYGSGSQPSNAAATPAPAASPETKSAQKPSSGGGGLGTGVIAGIVVAAVAVAGAAGGAVYWRRRKAAG